MLTKFFSRVIIASSTAALIAGPVFICLLFGLWLDGLMDTSPVMALFFGLVGFVASIVSLLKILKTIR
jgi:F0F1-type ATP synthase assembly protein I